jgi:hypothetical protein
MDEEKIGRGLGAAVGHWKKSCVVFIHRNLCRNFPSIFCVVSTHVSAEYYT